MRRVLAALFFAAIAIAPAAVKASDDCDFACQAGRTVQDGVIDMGKDRPMPDRKIIENQTDQNERENPLLQDNNSNSNNKDDDN